jgi:hypothetical protein
MRVLEALDSMRDEIKLAAMNMTGWRR